VTEKGAAGAEEEAEAERAGEGVSGRRLVVETGVERSGGKAVARGMGRRRHRRRGRRRE